MRALLLPLTVLLILASSTHALSAFEQEVLSASLVGVTIGFTIAALGYMVASVIGTPQALAWAKNEFYENFYTLFLVANVMLLAVAAQLFFVQFSGPPPAQQDFIQLAIEQVDAVMEGYDPNAITPTLQGQGYISTSKLGIKQLLMRSYAAESFVGLLSSSLNIHFQGLASISSSSTTAGGMGAIMAPSLNAPMFPGLTKVADLLEYINELIIMVLFMVIAHKGVLLFISEAGPKIFLVGILFRALPITRRLGSTLLALFITLQFVYPAFIAYAFSDDFYGKAVQDFSGTYINVDWFNGMPGMEGNYIIFLGPQDIIIYKEGTTANLSFTSTIPLFNYTVNEEGGSVLCNGIDATSEKPVECELPLDSMQRADIMDSETLGNYMKFYNITISFYADYYDEEMRLQPGYEYVYTLSVPVLVVQQCESTECSQQYIIKNQEFKEMRDAYIGGQTVGDVNDLYWSGVTGDIVSTGGKLAMSWATQKGFKKVSKTVVKEVAKKGFKGFLGKVIGGLVGGPFAVISFIISSVSIKSDLSTAMFDEIACDAYSGHMAEAYFEPTYTQPEVSDASWNVWYSMSKAIQNSWEFIVDSGGEMIDSSFKMYGESDYTSCAGSIGLFNEIMGSIAGWTTSGVVDNAREFNITILFTRVIMVFMISIFAIIITVTFFRSIAESIGGDSSLMGLGKLI